MHRSAHRRLRALALGTTTAALLMSVPADAAVTQGPPLTLPANVAGGCSPTIVLVAPSLPLAPSCTLLGLDTSGAWTLQTPRGQWVITRARVRAGTRVGPMAFTVLQALRSQAQAPGSNTASGIICCTAPVESQVFTPAPNAVTQINTRLPAKNTVDIVEGEPIEVVHYLAISTLDPASSPPVHQGAAVATAATSYMAPAIRAGQQRLSDGTALTPTMPLIQADYEPDADGDGFGDETQDSCPTDAAIRSAPVARAAQCRPSAPGTGPAPVGTTVLVAAVPSSSRRLRATAGSRAALLPVLCPAGAPGTCRGTVSAAAGRRITIAARRFSARPGRTVRVRLTLPAAVRQELRRRGRLALTVTVRQTAPTPGTARARVTLGRR